MSRPIFFLTDFGLADTYVGIVKAVILRIAPDARIVDLTHEIPPQDVRAGAFALLTAAPYLPEDAVVLAVVDPGVGTARRPIAVPGGRRTFVGPDNGLLSWVVDIASGAVVLDRPGFWLPTVSATFHGRDLFGPVAAHLARGVPLTEVGSPGGAIQTIPLPPTHRETGKDGETVAVHGEVIHVDRYGNLITSLTAADIPPDSVVEIHGQRIAGLAPHFQAGAGAIIALIGSAGFLEIAAPNGSARDVLSVAVGTPVRVAAAP